MTFADLRSPPFKGETLRRNAWVLLIPLLQYTLACAIVGISCVITCACTPRAAQKRPDPLAPSFQRHASEMPPFESLVSTGTAGFDAVMNSLAFTFISTVAEVFNQPLLRFYASTPISGLDPDEYGTEPIYYLVGEYNEANASSPEEGSQSWYVRQEDQLAGLLTDFHFRHQPSAYPRPNQRLVALMRLVFFCVPPVALALCVALNSPGVT